MLGHLKPSTCSISKPAQEAYQQFYCGICQSLRKEKGLAASLLINHELSLNLLALSPFMENKAVLQTTCPAAAFTQKKSTFQSETVSLASNLSVLLGWIKTTDWAFDSGKRVASLLKKKLEKWNNQLNHNLSDSLQQTIVQYIEVIQTRNPNSQLVEDSSGTLAKEIWLELSAQTTIPDHLKLNLSLLFEQIGKIIFLADAIEDYFQDKRKGLYNPIVAYTQNKGVTNTEALQHFYERYLLRLSFVRALLTSDRSIQKNSNEFVQVLLSSLSRMQSNVTKHRILIVEGTEPSFLSNLMETFQGWQVANGNCCCDNCNCDDCCKGCCSGGKCPCNNCNCNCQGCDCNSSGGSGGGCCDCNCDCCSCDVCCDSSGSSNNEELTPKEFKKELIREIMESDLPDSTKMEKVDSIFNLNDETLQDMLEDYEKRMDKE